MIQKPALVAVKVPAVDDVIYVDDLLCTPAGKSERFGGWAIVNSVREGMSGGEKVHFITVREFNGVEMNWEQYLAPEQRKLRNVFGKHHSGPA